MTDRRSAIFVSLTAAILVGSSAVGLCQQIGGPSPRIDTALLRKLSAGDEHFRVIVRLAAPEHATAPLSPHSSDGDRVRLAKGHDTVNLGLSGDVQIILRRRRNDAGLGLDLFGEFPSQLAAGTGDQYLHI